MSTRSGFHWPSHCSQVSRYSDGHPFSTTSDLKSNISAVSQNRKDLARTQAVILGDLKWPADKRTLWVQFLNGDSYHRAIVKHLVRKHYNSIDMNIKFEFISHGSSREYSDIRVCFTTTGVSCSAIGRNAEYCHRDDPTMWLNMLDHLKYNPDYSTDYRRSRRQADVLHEFGHALGMGHEHSNPKCNIDFDICKLQEKTGRRAESIIFQYGKRDNFLRAKVADYDPDSIMHYPVQAEDTLNIAESIGINKVLSRTDKKVLMTIYPVENPFSPRETRSVRKNQDAQDVQHRPTSAPNYDYNNQPGFDIIHQAGLINDVNSNINHSGFNNIMHQAISNNYTKHAAFDSCSSLTTVKNRFDFFRFDSNVKHGFRNSYMEKSSSLTTLSILSASTTMPHKLPPTTSSFKKVRFS